MLRDYMGALEAERRVERDHWLVHAFTWTRNLRMALDEDAPFIAGRKGAGKSAVAQRIGHLERPGNGVRYYDANFYIDGDMYKDLMNTLVDELTRRGILQGGNGNDLQAAYTHLWRYLLKLATLCVLGRLTALDSKQEAALAVAHTYLSATGLKAGSPTQFVGQRVIELAEIHQRVAMPAISFIMALSELEKDAALNAALAGAAPLVATRRVVIAVDTLEQYDLTYPKVEAFRGLVEAVKRFSDNPPADNVSVKCLLPSELIESIFDENQAKYYSVTGFLQWSYTELLSLLARRYALFLMAEPNAELQDAGERLQDDIGRGPNDGERQRDFWLRVFWRRFLPTIVANRCGWEEDACAYLIRHTQKRPREILSCMNHVMSYAELEGTLPLISADALRDGIHDPRNLHRLLSDNLAVFNVPRTDWSISDIAGHVLEGEQTVFSGTHFNDFVKRAYAHLRQEDVGDQHKFARDILLRSGLVGPVRETHNWHNAEGHACRYHLTRFEYCVPGHAVVNDASTCAVHPMLADFLGLGPPSGDHGAVYHLPERLDFIPGHDEGIEEL